MTIDRTALRGLVDMLIERSTTELSVDTIRALLASAAPDLLDDLDAKDRHIAELEKQNDRFVSIISACDERGEVGNTVDALAECRLRLSIATELNVGDRKKIGELEAGLREAIQWIADRSSDHSIFIARLSKLLPSEET